MNSNIILPKGLFESFINISSVNEDEFVKAHQQAPITSIRLNPFKKSNLFNSMPLIPWCENGRYLDHRPNFTADPLLHAGCYYVQEASSMFLEYALKQFVNFDEKIIALDLCAAPGGKSTLLSSLINDQSLLIANEVIQNRASILTENLTKWGKLNTWVTANDPKHFSSIKNLFDVVFVDAPCSGSGLFRKIPDFVNEWNMDTVNLCSQRQERILHDIFDSINNNGILVYMTCSFCEQENEEIVDYILNQFEVQSCKIDMPDEWGIVETQSKINKGYGYRFFPHLVKGEGFFLACFKKIGDEKEITHFDFARKTKSIVQQQALQKYVALENKMTLMQNDNLFLIEALHTHYVEYFSKHLKLIKKGILCGKIIRDELIPDHELAMFAECKKNVESIDLSYNEAIMYLQKENIEINCSQKGWYLVNFDGHDLGWIKNLGSRINNYYPSNYRILNKNILTPR